MEAFKMAETAGLLTAALQHKHTTLTPFCSEFLRPRTRQVWFVFMLTASLELLSLSSSTGS